MGKFGDCCSDATSENERPISKKSCYFLFIFSEIYEFLGSNFDNFSWKSEDISILKGFWKEKATTTFVIEYEKKRERKTTNYESLNFQTQLGFICSKSTK